MDDLTLLSKNALLRVLRDGDGSTIEGVNLVDVHTHQPIYETGQPMSEVYFPIDAVISVVTTLADGTSVEVGSIGSEGTTGIFTALGASTVPNATFCQVDGRCFVMPLATFEHYLSTVEPFRQVLNAYVIGYVNVLAQLVACNRLHPLDARCARWLLMTHESRGPRHLPTYAGVPCDDARRAPIRGHPGRSAFSDAGFIRYSRGTMTILERAGLEKEACECYDVERRQFNFPQAQ